MDLSYTDEERAFRDEVRDFMENEVPERLKRKVLEKKNLTKADMDEYHSLLNKRGWLGGGWPKEFGGQGWNAVYKGIFDGGDGPAPRAAHRAVRRVDARAGHPGVRLQGAAGNDPAAHPVG